ncbi:MAG: 5'/3'-nucleotidase SurE [Bacteroidales bacterium]|nr:MAG: 5'/3'-nucleotidase SurE [Bacteroidales bacterium]
MTKKRELLILITNDDGIKAKGLKSLVNVVKPLGKIVVVSPFEVHSGMSHAITVKVPLRVKKTREEHNLTVYGCNGTPVDCVKLAFNQILPRKPDLLVAGINHGSNAAASIFYSGTMAAALEGCINEIPSVGISLVSHNPDADLSATEFYSKLIIEKIIENGLPKSICLNVNVPKISLEKIAGIKVCRQTKGYWQEEFEKRTDPQGNKYFWLTGKFHNSEPEAHDTDEWALDNNYVSIVPIQVDLTSYHTMREIKNWNFT